MFMYILVEQPFKVIVTTNMGGGPAAYIRDIYKNGHWLGADKLDANMQKIEPPALNPNQLLEDIEAIITQSLNYTRPPLMLIHPNMVKALKEIAPSVDFVATEIAKEHVQG